MNHSEAKKKTNDRDTGYGEVGQCTIVPLEDHSGYYIDLSGSEGRMYRNIIKTVYVDYQTPLKAKDKVVIEGNPDGFYKDNSEDPATIVEGYIEVEDNLPETEPRGYRFKIGEDTLSIT